MADEMEPLAHVLMATYQRLLDSGMNREEAMNAIGGAVANFGVFVGAGMPMPGEEPAE